MDRPRLVSSGTGSDGEADGAQLFAAAVGNIRGSPSQYPLPVDAEAFDAVEPGEFAADLVLHNAGQRARCGRKGHGDDGGLPLNGDCADESVTLGKGSA